MKTKLHIAGMVIVPLSLLLVASGCNEKVPMSDSNRPVPESNRYADGTNKVVDADNSGKNVRDRNDATLTAGDQGTTPTDQALTQKIRKALVIDTSGYSMTAKNVKIITVNGKVTLRGPVNTAEEKTGIAGIARTVAGADNVDDQLEVKVNP